jgi:hypothetical protein
MSYIIGEEYFFLEPETHKFSAYEWHRKYKYECFIIFDFTCCKCDRKIVTSEGVVHHKTYKHEGGIYQARPDEIIDKICIMCHSCHEEEHTLKSIDGVTKKLIPKKPIFECVTCYEEFEYELIDGKCECCNDIYEKTMSEYIF